MAFLAGDRNATLKDLTVIVEDAIIQTRPLLHPLICTDVPEDGAYTKVPIATNMPFPKKFEGERSSQGKDVTVVQTYNQDTYELTIDLDADLVLNSKAWSFSDLVREATMSAIGFPDYLASQMVINGGTTAGYDGVNFYGSTHKFAKSGSNTIDNTVSKTGSTVPQLWTDVGTCLTKLRTFKDNQGRLINRLTDQGPNQLVIHCPVALEQPFRQLIQGSMIPVPVNVTTSGTAAAPAMENQLKGIANLVPDGYLDVNSATTWYMHYVGAPMRPFVFIENYGLRANVLGFGSEFQINTNKVRIALQQRFVLGYYRFERSVRVA